MSKRDALRKLRMEQKPIPTGDTPAEEYSKLAAEASKTDFIEPDKDDIKEEAKIELQPKYEVENKAVSEIIPETSEKPSEPVKTVVSSTPDSAQIHEPDVSGEESLPESPILTDKPQAKESLTENSTVASESDVPEEPIIESKPDVPEETIVNESEKEENAKAAPEEKEDEISISEPPKQAPVRKTKTNFKSVAQEPGKRISVSLKTENNNWMRRTAMRCGLSIQDYVNILLDEAWTREKRNPYVIKDSDPLPERLSSNKTILVAIKLSDENINRTKRLKASHCMTMTSYMNYLIQEEMKREEKYGMRAAIFDED